MLHAFLLLSFPKPWQRCDSANGNKTGSVSTQTPQTPDFRAYEEVVSEIWIHKMSRKYYSVVLLCVFPLLVWISQPTTTRTSISQAWTGSKNAQALQVFIYFCLFSTQAEGGKLKVEELMKQKHRMTNTRKCRYAGSWIRYKQAQKAENKQCYYTRRGGDN